MAKVIEFYVPKNFRKPMRTPAATRKNHRVLLADEEISLAAIHLLQIERNI